MNPRGLRTIAILAILAVVLGVGWWSGQAKRTAQTPGPFSGQRAYEDVVAQVEIGARHPGSPGHAQLIAWIQDSLRAAGWQPEVWEAEENGQRVQNIVARRGAGRPWVLLGAHFDTRPVADQDPDLTKRSLPVPGANDGASGVAVLLELARTLPQNTPGEVWLAFFDAEDSGSLPGWDWALGSRAFVRQLPGKPDAVIVVDMVGDRELNLPRERNSTPALGDAIWRQAAELGYGAQFLNRPGYSMLDDHTAFLQAGIPALDIIDFDYPYWHTTADTPDKVAPESLEAVGRTLAAWLGSGAPAAYPAP